MGWRDTFPGSFSKSSREFVWIFWIIAINCHSGNQTTAQDPVFEKKETKFKEKWEIFYFLRIVKHVSHLSRIIKIIFQTDNSNWVS